MIINLTINGIEKRIDVELDAYLLDVLRETGLNSVRRACDTSTCGICTVLLDDKPVLSCSVLAVRADGHSIITIEGIAKEAEKIADLMTKEVITINENATLDEIIAIMQEKQVGRLPVIDEKGILKGIVTRTDIIKAIN